MEDKKTGRPVAEGGSVQVMYDFQQQKTVPVDDQLLRKISALEGQDVVRKRAVG